MGKEGAWIILLEFATPSPSYHYFAGVFFIAQVEAEQIYI